MTSPDDNPWSGDCGRLRNWLIDRVLDLLIWLMPENDKTYLLRIYPSEGGMAAVLFEDKEKQEEK